MDNVNYKNLSPFYSEFIIAKAFHWNSFVFIDVFLRFAFNLVISSWFQATDEVMTIIYIKLISNSIFLPIARA